jgi:hypothetical protein
MANHRITNLRDVISDYPKIWEWTAEFENLDKSVTDLISGKQLTVLAENNQLPGFEVQDGEMTYKGAISHFGTRIMLDGVDLKLNFKEIKGETAQTSWLVRRGMKTWCHLIDDFFGAKKSIPQGKVTLKLTMEDETGGKVYRIKYYGVKPMSMEKVKLSYNVDAKYPTCNMIFSYDYFRQEGDTGYR